MEDYLLVGFVSNENSQSDEISTMSVLRKQKDHFCVINELRGEKAEKYYNILTASREKRKVGQVEQLTIDCIAQHLKVFHEQAMKERTADFAEPCSACPHVMKECRLDWLARMEPLFDRTEIQINLDLQELPNIKDSYGDRHEETEGSHRLQDNENPLSSIQ